jgi:hypothetical protein
MLALADIQARRRLRRGPRPPGGAKPAMVRA